MQLKRLSCAAEGLPQKCERTDNGAPSCARIFVNSLLGGPAVIVASQLREGMALRIDGQIYKVLESEFKAGGGPPRRYTVQRPR
jgi:hypothetical protein